MAVLRHLMPKIETFQPDGLKRPKAEVKTLTSLTHTKVLSEVVF